MSKQYNVVLVGIGAVGSEMLKILEQRSFPIGQLTILARSSRQEEINGKPYRVTKADPREFAGADFVFFAGTEGAKGASATYFPEAKKQGAVCIDNGADFRLDPEVPLVVPEVNPEDIALHQGLIASPNCSTIQMVVALAPLHRTSPIRRVIASTYQAVSGSGRAAIEELREQSPRVLAGDSVIPCQAYPQRIAFNVLPQIGGFAELDFTSEEWKMDRETAKILHSPEIRVSATTIRVPVFNVHSESVYIETDRPIPVEEAREILKNAPGVVLIDEPEQGKYPTCLDADGEDPVFVGRIRRDPHIANGLHLWIVSDNIRKGAALNVIQIAERMIADGMV